MSNTLVSQSIVKSVSKQQEATAAPVQSTLRGDQVKKEKDIPSDAFSAQGKELSSDLNKQTAEQVEVLREKVALLNSHMQNLNRTLQFLVDDISGDTIVRVIDSETDKLIRQVPAQDILDVKNALEEYRGLLLETKA